MGTPFSFGSYHYELPTGGLTGSRSIITSYPTELQSRLRTADAPDSIDQYTAGGLPGPRRLTLSGVLKAEDGDDIEDLWEAFTLAHDAGQPQALYLKDDDRYLLAEVETIRDVNAANTIGAREWSVTFLCQSPYWREDTASTQAATVAGDHLSASIALTVGGNRPTRAVLTIALSSVGADIDSALTITNTTTGAAPLVMWARSATGNIVVDCAAEAITQNGDDAQAILLSGPWLSLLPGTNNLTITAAGGAHITSASASCYGRKR